MLFAGDVRLYNRPELLSELVLPSALRTCSDLELARLAYLRWRHEAPQHLVGDFAFAAWDENEATLFAARDHIGMRPLYYRVLADGIVVASDVRQILAIVERPFDNVDHQRVLYWTGGWAGDLERTFFRGISRLRPGHHLLADARGAKQRRYWLPPAMPEEPASYEDNCERLRELFGRAVRDRLESDLPIVAHSSGGFDSSTILMAADRVYRSEPGRPPLTMVSAVAPGYPSDESGYMDAVAARVGFEGVRWNVVDETPTTFPGVSRAAPVLRRGLAGGARRDLEIAHERGARVLLSGLVGDDIWYAAGVLRDFFRHGRWISLLRSLILSGSGFAAAQRGLNALTGILSPVTAVRLATKGIGLPPAPSEWLGPALREIYRGGAMPIDLPDVVWPSHMVCSIWAQLTMAQATAVIESVVEHALDDGIELRAPCADIRLIEHVLRIPWHQREPRGHFRRTARDALGSLLPPEFAARRGQQPWTAVWHANARRTVSGIAPIIERGGWRSAPFIDRGIARAMLRVAIAGGGASVPETCLLVSEFGALEAWLRELLLYNPPRRGGQMSDRPNNSEFVENISERLKKPYEAPILTHIGNARDLLAGNSGTQTDAIPVPLMPTQPGS